VSEPRTPEEALAEAMLAGIPEELRSPAGAATGAAAILAALPEPHRQAWLDGLALARLREAFPAGWAKVAVDLTFEPGHVALAVWPLDNHPRSGVPMRRARTVAEAADAVREALG